VIDVVTSDGPTKDFLGRTGHRAAILAIGSGSYGVLCAVAGVCAIIGSAAILPVKSVRQSRLGLAIATL
jgi:hypothetical protein